MKIRESGDIHGITQAVEAKMIRFVTEESHCTEDHGERREYSADGIRQTLLEEYELSVFSAGKPLFHLTCTPDQLPCLVAGHLLTEGWIRSGQDVISLEIERDRGRADIVFASSFLPDAGSKPKDPREIKKLSQADSSWKTISRPIEKTGKGPDWDETWIRQLYRRFCQDTDLHRATRSTHSAFLMYEGRIVAEAEDIGRHNAVDKVIGYALLHQVPPASCLLFTTGRLPEDMVMKSARAGIPVLVSKEVPTTAGLRAARAAGITIIGKVRDHSMVLYTEAEVS